MGRRSRYVEGAFVAGFAAHVLDRLLARHLPALLQSTPFTVEQREDLEAARVAIGRAADVYGSQPIAVDGSAATPVAAIGTPSTREEISTAEAAVLLGVRERRARQLAERGLGRKIGRTWVLDRAAVLAYRDERRSA